MLFFWPAGEIVGHILSDMNASEWFQDLRLADRINLPWNHPPPFCCPKFFLPNQQRTLDKLPTELRCRNFVSKHPTEYTNQRQTCKNVHAMCTYIFQLSFHFAFHRWWLGNLKLAERSFCATTFFFPLFLSELSTVATEEEKKIFGRDLVIQFQKCRSSCSSSVCV